VKELVDWAKANPGKLNYSSLGNGSSAHLTMELFLSEAGITGTHIPFNGSPPAAMAVAQGEADTTFMVAPALMAHVRNSKVRLLAVSSAQRPDTLKDLPTLADAGYRNVESLAWNGLFAPAGTPAAVVTRINADVNAVLGDAAVKSLLDGQGLTVVGGSAADFQRVLDAETKRWGPIIARIGRSWTDPAAGPLRPGHGASSGPAAAAGTDVRRAASGLRLIGAADLGLPVVSAVRCALALVGLGGRLVTELVAVVFDLAALRRLFVARVLLVGVGH
jgi:hypothetical protein